MSQAGIANLGVIPPPPGSVTDLQGQDGVTVPPNGGGIIFVVGAVAAAGATPFTTTGNAGTSTETWTIQRTQAIASTNAANVGLAAFDSARFTVDANGFVSLNGSGVGETITGDTGGPLAPTAGNWNIFGQPANTTQVMETHNITGDFWVENRSWQTQYVVDPSSTVGLQGTYTTIAAALAAAVADGMAFNNFKKIYIRTGTYTENLAIPPGAILVGETISLPTGGVVTPLNNTLITGNHTFTGNAICAFNNIVFTAAAGNMFSGGAAAICLLYFDNCLLVNGGSSALFTGFPSSSYISMTGCTMGGSGDTLAFDVTDSTVNLSNGVFSQPLNITLNASRFLANNTTGIGFVTVGVGSSIKVLSSTFLLAGTHDYHIDSTASSTQNILTSCFFEGTYTIASLSPTLANTPWVIQKCATSQPGGVASKLYANTAVTTSFTVGDQGNLIKSTRTAINLQMDINDYYVGVTSTAAPRTIFLPDGTGSVTPQKDQVFIINDESGGAGTNNITVTTTGGVVLIDGQTSQVINTNYGNTTVIFDGTNYFTVNASAAVATDLHITPFIVSAAGSANGASFTTIQAALTAANAAGGGIVYVQPGSYTENLTLFADTEIVGTPGNSDAGSTGNTVIITGVHTPPATGSFTFANVRLVSATDIFNSAVAGSAGLIIENSFIAITNGFLFNLPNWTGTFITYNIGEGSTNNGMVNNTGGATCFFISATHGAGTGQTMITTGPVIMEEVVLNCPWSANTGTTIACDYVIFNQMVTAANDSTGAFHWCRFSAEAPAALTMSSSAAIKLTHCTIDSPSNPAIAGAGAGTLTYSDLVFLSNSAFAGTLTLGTVSWRPYSVALAATDGTKVGTCNFNSAHFTVDANGFVSSLGNGFPWIDQATGIVLAVNTGYFVTAATTQTLPAAPTQGQVVKIVADTTGAVVVTANTGQVIRSGTTASSTAGTMTSTLQGDSLELVFRAATSTWISIATNGVWVPA